MATAEEYAAWIVKNADKQGTPEFETVARAYQTVRSQVSAKAGEGMPSDRVPAPETPSESPAPRLPKRGGFAKQVGEALYTPAETPRIPTAEELAGRYKDIGTGTLQGVPAGIAGLPGDIAGLVGVSNPFTSHKIADYMFGPAGSRDVQSGRTIGGLISGFAGPGAATKIVAPLREAAEAAKLAKTAQALRGIELALDPLSPIVSGAITAGAKGYNALRDVANYAIGPGATAENRLVAMTADPEAALRAMQNTKTMLTSGGPVSVSERLAAGNVAEPRVAAAQEALAEGKTALPVQQAQQERIAAIQSNLQNVEQQIAQKANALTPAATAQLNEVRNSLLRSLAEEQATLEAAGGRITGQIPNPSQQAVGQALTQTAATGARETAANVVQPAYAAVIREAGDVPINLERPLAAAQAVRGSPTGIMDASTVPQGIRALENFRAAPLPGEAIPSVIPGLPGRTGAPIPQPSTVTPAEFMSVRAELARDLRDAQGANNFPAVRHMRGILAEMDAAFAQSGVTPRTLELYADAGRLHGTETVARSRTGETAQMLQPGANNRPQLLPENVAAAFLKGETPAEQFVTTFRNDPAAAAQMSQGVGGLFRDAVIGADGLVDAQKASAFVRDHRRQLDILENSGVRITDQLAAITEQAATNARQRQALAEGTASLRNAPSAEDAIDLALKSAPQMDILVGHLSADGRAALAANVKNRALDAIKAGDPDAALKFLTENKKTIQQAIGRTGAAEHTAMLNMAKTQQQLMKTKDALPNIGLYDPIVLASKFPPSQLTDLRTAVDEIARMKQMSKVAEAGGGARVAPAATSWGEIVSANPLVWAKTIAAKMGKNWADQRITSEAFQVMYADPERFTAALDRAIKQKKTVENIRTGSRQVANSFVARPAVNALADQQGRR
jgi:hypothetical protein